MSLVDPTNPARWADGTKRSQNNGFTNGFGEPVNWKPMQRAEHMRHVSAAVVQRARANGTDHSSIHGLSKKGDAHIRATKRLPAGMSTNTSQVKNKTQRLREALAAGPMTSRELAAVTGINMDHVPSLLQWSVSIGQVRKLRDTKPFRYALPQAAAIVARSYCPAIENQAAGQKSADKRAKLRRGTIG